jgi:hypothetical protein
LLASALSDQDGPLHLVTTIRSDFMMQFTALPRLQALLHEKAARYLLNPIDGHGLKDVVQTPAKLAGLRWSDDLLPDEIVQEARDEPGALPLVENLLRLLWLESRNGQSNELSRNVYNELGGVGGALSKSADALLESLGDGKQKALNLLTALVNVGGDRQDIQDTRRTIPKSVALQAAGGGEQAETILNQLSGLRGRDTSRGAPARPRLVVLSTATRNEASTDLVDLAHETLLRYNRDKEPYWGTLRTEITKRRKEIQNLQLAEALAKEWRENGGSRWSGLATRTQRKAFRRLRDLKEDAVAYVNASRRKSWIQTGVIGMLILLFGGLVTWSWREGVTVQYAGSIVRARLHMVQVREPEMVRIPNQPVLLGRYEVTFDEYDQYVDMTAGRRPLDQGWGRETRPVINVSWDDGVAYAKWLSTATGKRYRLPTDQEWVYAATSGGKGEKYAGTSREEELSDYAWNFLNSLRRTQPVGKKKPNGLGLYDMSGNVDEWVKDCFDGGTDADKCISQDFIGQTASPHRVYAAKIFSFANATLSRNVCIGVLP